MNRTVGFVTALLLSSSVMAQHSQALGCRAEFFSALEELEAAQRGDDCSAALGKPCTWTQQSLGNNPGHESSDYGVPPQKELRDFVDSSTPTTIPGAKVIT